MTNQAEPQPINPPVNLGRRLTRVENLYSQAVLDNAAKDAYIEDCHEHIAKLEAQLAERGGAVDEQRD
ncbi:hypothetical protein [Kocuria rosea]|uniref:hypothetical protein n=1 Tax=Kocuria rosea TaxID=1275 RepID=UPI0011A22277|nr:hypothetical protein [Kocuria rosea]